MAQAPLRFIQIGTGGFGGYWARQVLPRLVQTGKLAPAAAVDIQQDHLANAVEGLAAGRS